MPLGRPGCRAAVSLAFEKLPRKIPPMTFARRFRVWLAFAILLVFCSVMVVLQMQANLSKHVELREAFILLESKGYRPQAQRLYQKLIKELESLPNQGLLDDYDRTLALLGGTKDDKDNLIWRYHWTVSNEMDQRSHSALGRALKMAEEP